MNFTGRTNTPKCLSKKLIRTQNNDITSAIWQALEPLPNIQYDVKPRQLVGSTSTEAICLHLIDSQETPPLLRAWPLFPGSLLSTEINVTTQKFVVSQIVENARVAEDISSLSTGLLNTSPLFYSLNHPVPLYLNTRR